MSHTDLGYDCMSCRDTGRLYNVEQPCHCQKEKSMPTPAKGKEYYHTSTTRTFNTGATRDTDQGKHDYEGYISPKVLKRFGEYMTKNRVQSDGNVRDSDNWQKGIPRDQYIKSLLRHTVDAWDAHRDKSLSRDGLHEALCGIMFNAMGYLHEDMKENFVQRLEEIKYNPLPITKGD